MADRAITKASSDYQKLLELFTQVDAVKTAEIAADEKFTREEIVDLFDGKDQKWQLDDLNLPALSKFPQLFGQVDDILQRNKESGGVYLYYDLPSDELEAAIQKFCETGRADPPSLLHSSRFLFSVLWKDAQAARFVPRVMFERFDSLPYSAVSHDPLALEHVPVECLRRDPGVALTAVRKNGDALQFVPEDVQLSTPEIVQVALMESSAAFAFVAPEFQIAHPELVQAMWGILGDDILTDIVPEFWDAHPHAGDVDWEALRSRPMDVDDPDSLMAWLTLDGMNLQYVPDDAQTGNPGAVFAALLQNPEALRFTSPGFQLQNTDVVWTTLVKTEEPETFYLTDELQIAEKRRLTELLGASGSLEHLSSQLARVSPQTYYDCVKSTLESNGSELRFVPQAYLEKHPELVGITVKNDSLALQFTNAAWQIKNPTATLTAVKDYWRALEFLTPEFRVHHPKTTLKAVEAAVEQDPEAIRFTSEEFQLAHVALVYKAVDKSRDQTLSREPILYSVSDGFLRAYPDLLTRVIGQHPGEILPLVEAVNEFCQGVTGPHDILVEMAASLGGSSYVWNEGLTPDYAKNSFLPEFLADTFLGNMGVLAPLLELNPDMLSKVWASVQRQARTQGVSFPAGVMDSPYAFQEFLSEHTEFPERFHSLKTVQEVFVEGENPKDPYLPVALLLYNKDDWNGAFQSKVIDDIAADGRFRVVYREVDSDDDVEDALEEFGPVHTLVLAGHGSKTTLQLGKPDPEKKENYVDTEDYDRCDEELEKKYFIPGGQILLYACSNGEGGSEDDNLHRTMTWTFPHVSVYSSPLPSNIKGLSFDGDKHLEIELWDSNPVISQPSLQP